MRIYEQLPGALLPWYLKGHRQLPWRQTKDPYKIWVSEIMLQQTRVEAVKGYYARFLVALPTIESLANADDALLHKLWEGLGYYSRVRNLKKAAKVIMEQHGGQFPQSYEQVLALPGIGEYTVGAICSIAFNLPTPAVDGNVLRVISRLTDDATPIDSPAYKKQVRNALASIYPQNAGYFTQALMELGATVCGPNRKPDCENCPCAGFCQGKEHAEHLPIKSPKRQRRVEEKTVFILRCGDRFALIKRANTGLLAGLWQFPEVPGHLNANQYVAEMERLGLKPKDIMLQVECKHIFTHIEWHMRGVYATVAEPIESYSWFPLEVIHQEIPLPTAYRQFLDHI